MSLWRWTQLSAISHQPSGRGSRFSAYDLAYDCRTKKSALGAGLRLVADSTRRVVASTIAIAVRPCRCRFLSTRGLVWSGYSRVLRIRIRLHYHGDSREAH